MEVQATRGLWLDHVIALCVGREGVLEHVGGGDVAHTPATRVVVHVDLDEGCSGVRVRVRVRVRDVVE